MEDLTPGEDLTSGQQTSQLDEGKTAAGADTTPHPHPHLAHRSSRLARRYQTVLEIAPDATVVSDSQGEIVLVNRQTELLYGYRREDLLGQPVERLIPETLHDPHRQYRAAHLVAPSTGPMRLTGERVYGRRRDGTAFPAEVSLSTFVEDSDTYVIATIHDVSELQRVQAAQQAAESAAEDLRRLQAVTDTALSHLELHDLLAELLDRVREALAGDYASVSLLDATKQQLRLEAAKGPGPLPATAAPIPVGQGMGGRVAATQAPLVVDDLSSFPTINSAFFAGQQSAVGVPLLMRKQLLGVLVVSTGQTRRFTPHDVALLQRVAERIAVAMERSQLYEAERDARAEAEVARTAAERQAAQLDRIFEQLTEALVVYDLEGRILRENAAMRRLRGGDTTSPEVAQPPLAERLALYRLRDMRGREFAPAETPATRALRGEVLTGEQAMDVQMRTPDGREVELRISAAPLRDGMERIVGAVLSTVDLTEHNRLEREREAALTASEAWFRMLADTAPVLVWVSGLDGLVTFVNLPWLQFTGRTLEQELGDGWAEGVHPDDYDRCLDTYRTAFQAREPFTMEYRLRRADGEYRWLVDTGTPRSTPGGAFAGYIGSCIDISERHELEQARASELALREVNERLDTFVSMAAHDLRAPVGASLLAVQLAQRQLRQTAAGGRPNESKGQQAQKQAAIRAGQALAMTEGQLDRLTRLVQQLLDVERVRVGTFVLDRQPVDLVALVRSAVEEQRLLSPDRVFVLHLPSLPSPAAPETDTPEVVVDADADRLGQVLTNYLANAVRYAPEDQPIEVIVQVTEPGVESNSHTDGDRRAARVAVRDHGPGIAPEDQATIWDRFQRARSVREAKGGLGLGLYISRTIIERHGGQVGVDSAPGQGSCFWFELPLERRV